MQKYNPQENGIRKRGFSYSNSEIHQSAALAKNLKDDDMVGTSLRIAVLNFDPKRPLTNMHPTQDSTKIDNVTNKDTMVSLLPFSVFVEDGPSR